MKPITNLGDYQAELAQMLLSMNRVCRENGLTYVLVFGTALGAFRDSNLIPWDRDADVAVRLDEYDNFCATLRRELPPTLKIEDCNSSKDYDVLFARVGAVGVDHDHLHIDIYPMAGAPSSPLIQLLVIHAYKILSQIFTAKRADLSKRTWWGVRRKTIARLIKLLTIPLTERVIVRAHSRLAYMFAMTPTSPAMIVSGTDRRRELMPEKFYSSPHSLRFLGEEFSMPGNPEEYLTRMYGDFRTLPSLDIQRDEKAFFDKEVLPHLNR